MYSCIWISHTGKPQNNWIIGMVNPLSTELSFSTIHVFPAIQPGPLQTWSNWSEDKYYIICLNYFAVHTATSSTSINHCKSSCISKTHLQRTSIASTVHQKLWSLNCSCHVMTVAIITAGKTEICTEFNSYSIGFRSRFSRYVIWAWI